MNSLLDAGTEESLKAKPPLMQRIKTRRSVRIATVALAVTVVLLTGVFVGRYLLPTGTHNAVVAPTSGAAATTPTTTKPVVPPPATTQPGATPVQPSFDFARDVVHGTEGVEHPIIRILMEHPEIIPGGFTGDANDKAALKKWAGVQSHLLAYRGGLIGPHFREEIWVLHPNMVAVQLEKNQDGSLRIAMYLVQNGVMATSPVVNHNVAPTVAAARFIGPQNGTTALSAPYSSIEYMHVPN